MNKSTGQSETFYARINGNGKFEKLNPNPFETTITMEVDDITTKEIEAEEKTKQDYDKLLLKLYWFLKGINHNNVSNTVCDLLIEIEEFIDNE